MEAPSVKGGRKVGHNSSRHYSDSPNHRYFNIYGPNPEYRRNSIEYETRTSKKKKIALSVK